VDERALLVPQQGVTRDPTGRANALVVDAENKVVRKSVVLGRAVGNRWVVREGLAAGDRVLVEGSQKVKPGDTVKPVEVARTAAGPRNGASAPAGGASSPDAGAPAPAAAASR
jgi:membrane fusion protein (multidrug efflux system)